MDSRNYWAELCRTAPDMEKIAADVFNRAFQPGGYVYEQDRRQRECLIDEAVRRVCPHGTNFWDDTYTVHSFRIRCDAIIKIRAEFRRLTGEAS